MWPACKMGPSTVFLLQLIFSVGFSSPIIRGVDVLDLEVFPEIVHIQLKVRSKSEDKITYSSCAGVLLEFDVVLTAGHCIDKPHDNIVEIVVRAGIRRLQNNTSTGQKLFVKGYKVHEDFVFLRKNLIMYNEYHTNDLALLWLYSGVQFNAGVQKFKLPESAMSVVNEEVVIAGWGRTESGFHSENLKKAILRGITNSECQNMYKPVGISKNVFCVISDDRKSGASIGDSGGPLVYDDTLIGILSFGKIMKLKRTDGRVVDSCNPDFAAVYTNVFSYLPWIKESLRNGPPTEVCKTYGKYCALNCEQMELSTSLR